MTSSSTEAESVATTATTDTITPTTTTTTTTTMHTESETQPEPVPDSDADADVDVNAEVEMCLCSSEHCSQSASTLKCPTCVQLNAEPSYFCSQRCFKANWKRHNFLAHQLINDARAREQGQKAFKVPKWNFHGALRPWFQTPRRKVPAAISRPDYAQTGTPLSEMRANRERPKHIPIYTAQEIAGVRYACKLGRQVLDLAGHLVRPGITTDEIDAHVHQACVERECYPSPLNYHSFPKSCCTSVNEVICHGIPDSRPLENGDIVNIDITVYKNGFHGDLNETFLVGTVDPAYKNLVKATYEAMMTSIEKVKPNVMCRKYGEFIDTSVRKYGYQVVRTYCGHGIGRMFHCNPNIPHYRRNKAVGKLKAGMIFTIEPMINVGSWKDETWAFDNWTSSTIDGKRSAQFEHTILVTHDGYEILTGRTHNSLPFWWDVEPAEDTASLVSAQALHNNNNNRLNTNESDTKMMDKNENATNNNANHSKKKQSNSPKKNNNRRNAKNNSRNRNKRQNKQNKQRQKQKTKQKQQKNKKPANANNNKKNPQAPDVPMTN